MLTGNLKRKKQGEKMGVRGNGSKRGRLICIQAWPVPGLALAGMLMTFSVEENSQPPGISRSHDYGLTISRDLHLLTSRPSNRPSNIRSFGQSNSKRKTIIANGQGKNRGGRLRPRIVSLTSRRPRRIHPACYATRRCSLRSPSSSGRLLSASSGSSSEYEVREAYGRSSCGPERRWSTPAYFADKPGTF